ncbi:hypothetical protein BDR26DRAFT_868145, partial [Obelidium mucronatum]
MPSLSHLIAALIQLVLFLTAFSNSLPLHAPTLQPTAEPAQSQSHASSVQIFQSILDTCPPCLTSCLSNNALLAQSTLCDASRSTGSLSIPIALEMCLSSTCAPSDVNLIVTMLEARSDEILRECKGGLLLWNTSSGSSPVESTTVAVAHVDDKPHPTGSTPATSTIATAAAAAEGDAGLKFFPSNEKEQKIPAVWTVFLIVFFSVLIIYGIRSCWIKLSQV